jgi:hypothetical protein
MTKTDKEHGDDIKHKLQALCAAIDDALTAGLQVKLALNASDTWGRSEQFPNGRVRGGSIKITREYEP